MSADIVERLNLRGLAADRARAFSDSVLFDEAIAEIVRLRAEVAERADDLTTAYMAGRFDGKAIAPAEAKGDACNCPGGSKRDPEKHAPNCPVRTLPCRTLVNPFDTPQPAGGEAVAIGKLVRPYPPGVGVILKAGHKSGATTIIPNENALSLPPGEYDVYTTPPAAQVQQEADFPMTDAQVRQWIGACNHEPARQVLRDYLQLRSTHPAGDALGAVRELSGKWRSRTPRHADAEAAYRVCADELEAALRPSAGEGKGISASHKKHDGPCWRNSHADCGC